ncbi:MASE1 domain-containing protein [Dyella koreensis]
MRGGVMQSRPWAGALFRNIAIAASYGAALVLFRQLSIPHWIILTGFHLSVLLLTRYKYWPALIVGGMARMAYISITCYPQFGLVWSLVNLIPSICYFIPVVWLFRQRWDLFPKSSAVNMPALLLCSLIVAGIATLVTIGQVLLTPLPPGYVLHYGEVGARLVLGNFLGILTITPISLVFRQLFIDAQGRWREWAHEVVESRLMVEGVLLTVPMLAFLVWLGLHDPRVREIAQMAMFLPVIWLALRHGWRGAAMGGTWASFAIMALMPARNDYATLQAETLIAMAISTMLLVGARIAVLDRRAEQGHADMRRAHALAQRNVHLGEAQMRVTAQALDQIRESIDNVFFRMLGRLRHLQPVIEDAGYHRQALSTQDQLFRVADSLYPLALRERGLISALREGALARTLAEAGIYFWCDVRGPLSLFTQSTHVAIYRVIGEAIAEACAQRDISDILVKVRCGTRGRLWVVVQVDARANPVHLPHIQWDELLPRLRRSTSGLGRKAIVDRAATFEGQVRERPLRKGRRLVVQLLNPPHPDD